MSGWSLKDKEVADEPQLDISDCIDDIDEESLSSSPVELL